MNYSCASSARALLTAVIIVILLPAGLAASDQSPPEATTQATRPDYATITRALDGDPAAIESLAACADGNSDCRTIAAAALHRLGRAEEVVELLRPQLAHGDQRAAQILAEVAFERQD